MNNNEYTKAQRKRRDFRNKLLLEVFAGLVLSSVIGLTVGSFDGFEDYEFSTDFLFSSGIVTTFLSFFIGAWICSIYEMRKSFPERVAQEYLNEWRDHYPHMTHFFEARFERMSEKFDETVRTLIGGCGERWSTDIRLETANLICDGVKNISSYSAISTDSPCLTPSIPKSFYARQAKRLPHRKTRRILVYPLDKLMEDLCCKDRRKNLNEFIRIHKDFELRYLPQSIAELRKNLYIYLGSAKEKILVDFGIIESSDNHSIVFGQEANDCDADSVSGRGHIIIAEGTVADYIALFNLLWSGNDWIFCSAAQLSFYSFLMNMREEMIESLVGSHALEGEEFFCDCLKNIKSSSYVHAIDLADDIGVWWRNNEYIDFKNATIDALKNGGDANRIYVLKRGFDALGEAEIFVNEVLNPQLIAGVKIGLVYSESLVDNNIGAIDLIFNETGWGFYLMPGDRFQYSSVFQARNMISAKFKADLEKRFGDLLDLVNKEGMFFSVRIDNLKPVIDWLTRNKFTHK